jgi:hypothetical protein
MFRGAAGGVARSPNPAADGAQEGRGGVADRESSQEGANMGKSSEHLSERERRLEEVIASYYRALEAGRPPERAALLAGHPELADELAAFLDDKAAFERRASPAAPEVPATEAARGPAPPRPLGTVRYFGDYELLEEIARGGMGVAYRARQVSLNRPVAFKMILAGALATDPDVRRFHREAEADGPVFQHGRQARGRGRVHPGPARPGDRRPGHSKGAGLGGAGGHGPVPVTNDQTRAVAFGPDGRQVLAAGARRAYTWDTLGAQHGGFALNTEVAKAAFSPDGRRLATAGHDGRITLWDIRTGQQMLSLAGFNIPTALTFSPNGKRLASAGLEGDRGVVKIWDATPPAR